MSDPFAALEAEEEVVGPPPPPRKAVAPTQSIDMGQQGMTRERHNLRDPDTENKWYQAVSDAYDNMDLGLQGVSRGMLQIPTVGHADELAGAASAATGGSYREGRDAYRAQGARISEAAPGTETAGEVIAGGAVGGPAKLYQQMLMGAAYGAGAAPEMSNVPLYMAGGAAAPVALAAPGAAIRAGKAVGGALGNIARDAIHSPNAPQIASTMLAKAGGAASGSAAGGALDAVLPIPGVGSAVGSAIGMGTAKPNAVTDAAGQKMVNYLRTKIGPRKVQLSPEDINYTLPQRAPTAQAEAIPVPAEPAPASVMQSLDDYLGPESVGAVTGRPAALGAVPKGAPPAPEIGINPLRMGPEDYRGSVGPDYADVSFPKPAPVPSQSGFPTDPYIAPTPAPWGADPHAYPSRIPTAPQVEGPNYFDFKLPPPAPAPAPPIETVNTLRPPALPSLPPGTQATNPYVPGTRPIPPSIQEPPSFAAINAPTTPYNPPAPAGAANRMTLRHGEAPPSFVPQPTPAQPSRQTVPFVERLAKAAEVTDNPEVQTTLEKIATMHAEDPVKASAYHKVQLSKNPAYRETLRIIEGK